MNNRLLHNIRHFITAPLRYRTRRGFGVHSPFAFKYLMDVWGEKSAYYAYNEISNKYNRLIFRTLNYLQPKTIAMHGADSGTEKAIKLGAPKADTVSADSKAECYVITGKMPNIPAKQLIDEKANFAVIHLKPQPCARLFDESGYGMSFGNNKIRIYIMLRKLPRQDFNVWL